MECKCKEFEGSSYVILEGREPILLKRKVAQALVMLLEAGVTGEYDGLADVIELGINTHWNSIEEDKEWQKKQKEKYDEELLARWNT